MLRILIWGDFWMLILFMRGQLPSFLFRKNKHILKHCFIMYKLFVLQLCNNYFIIN